MICLAGFFFGQKGELKILKACASEDIGLNGHGLMSIITFGGVYISVDAIFKGIIISIRAATHRTFNFNLLPYFLG